MFHCRSGAGYAIDALFPTFYEMAQKLVRDEKIHISFTGLDECTGNINFQDYENLIEFEPATKQRSKLEFIEQYIRKNEIDVVFGFDQPAKQLSYKYLRKGGVKKIISYWGAPMSDLNTGIKLKLKQLGMLFSKNSPDHYIFESMIMAKSAYAGRGINKQKVSVVHLGVDTDEFHPVKEDMSYAHATFKIPKERKIIYYSGHMEERKGVAVLLRAAQQLYEVCNRRDFHFLLLGNQHGEEVALLDKLGTTKAKEHITFGGYRTDVKNIIPCCYAGAIASTGWDSFTMSSLEMASCGLPLMVSNLQGLAETVDDKITGFLFSPGNHGQLSEHICNLLDDPSMKDNMSKNARRRIMEGFTRDHQISRLTATVRSVID